MKIGESVAFFSGENHVQHNLNPEFGDIKRFKDVKKCLQTAPDVILVRAQEFVKQWRPIFMALRKRVLDPLFVIIYNHSDDMDVHYFLSRGVRVFMKPEESLDEVLEAERNSGARIPNDLSARLAQHHNLLMPRFKKLTHRQFDVACALIEGKTYKTIATEHNSSIETIRDHVKNIYRHFEINSKTELMELKSHFSGVAID